MASTYNFPDHKSGNTFKGVRFNVVVNSVVPVLTDVVMTVSDKKRKYTMSVDNGDIELTAGIDGTFDVLEQVLNFAPGTYDVAIKIYIQPGSEDDPDIEKTYITGKWTITE